MTIGFRLSLQQDRLWSLCNANGPFPARVAAFYRIDGQVDEMRLRKALTRLVSEFEIFRTHYPIPDGMKKPLQVVGEAAYDWCSDTSQVIEDHESARKHLREMLTFSREEQPVEPLVVGFIPLNSEQSLLGISLPSLSVDTLSFIMLPKLLAKAYDGHDISADEEPLQYHQASEWAHDLVASEDAEAGIQFWRETQLARGLDLSLPGANRFETPRAYAFQRTQPLAISEATFNRLEELAATFESSTVGLCLAAWCALVAKLTGNHTPVVGVAMDARTEEDLEGVFGPLTSYIPLCFNLPRDVEFGQLVEAVDAETERVYPWLECFNWRHIPDVDHRMTPFFPVSFAYGELPEPGDSEDVTFTYLENDATSDRSDITLRCDYSEDRLQLQLKYDGDVISKTLAERMLGRVGAVLDRVAKQPNVSMRFLDIVPEQERRLLLEGFNGESMAVPENSCVSRLFEATAKRFSERPAIQFEGKSVTYAELNQRANQVANCLREAGVRLGTSVGLCLPRSLDYFAALLGIFKSGGVYLPLDATYPPERLRFMILDSQVNILITNDAFSERLPSEPMRIILDAEMTGQASDNLSESPLPNSDAYIIYTSGTTGKPKGTVISQRAILSHALAAKALFELDEKDRMLQFASFNFDASLDQIWPPWLAGACVVSRDTEVWDAAEAVQAVGRLDLTVVNFPTAYWALIATALLRTRTAAHPRLVIVGGEQMLPGTLRQWHRSAWGNVRLLNAYGPTETTVTASAADLSRADFADGSNIPIGRSLANRRLVVVDAHLQLLPVASDGELLIGGEGLSRGYLGRVKQTAERFVPDPFGMEPGGRLYRTGDRVRFLDDGELLFLGRVDRQIKLRGFRIELGEIETSLTNHPSVEQAAVIVQTQGSLDRDVRLIAYVTGANGEIEIGQLKQDLAANLPEYMVPSAIVVLETMPTTAAGKIDQKALPLPEEVDKASSRSDLQQTPTAEVLAGLWSELMQRAVVRSDEDFFNQGGHSLMAMQLVARLREIFHINVPLQIIFQNSRLADQATAIDRLIQKQKGLEVPVLEPMPREGAIPLSRAQRRLWFLYCMDPTSSAYHVPTTLKIQGRLDLTALESAFSDLVARHDILRTRYAMSGEIPVQIIGEQVRFSLPVQDLSKKSDEEREPLVNQAIRDNALKPFDLENGPIFRAGLVKLADDIYMLLINIHHIASDGWSMGILTRELLALYQAHHIGETANLPDLSVQYADVAIWQEQWLSDRFLDRELEYWRGRLENMPMLQPLPLADAAKVGSVGAFPPISFTVDADKHRQLRQLARQENATMFMVLLTAFEAMIFAFTGEEDMVIGTDVAGRHEPSMEKLIGFFVNQLVLRTSLNGAPTLRDLIGRVRRTALEGYAHQSVSFDRLVEFLNPDRGDGKRSPLFQRKFTLQNTPLAHVEHPDFVLTPMDGEAMHAKFDLLLDIDDRDENLHCQFRYNDAIYTPAIMQRLVTYFQMVIDRMVDDPDVSISTLAAALQAKEAEYTQQQQSELTASTRDKFKNLRRMART